MGLLAQNALGMSQNVQQKVDSFVPAEIKFNPDVEQFNPANPNPQSPRVYQVSPM